MSDRVKIKKASYEVTVIGGGLSGVCAAIACARHGARTALIHERHVLGGNASSEIRMHVCGATENMQKPDLEEGGILYELMLENKSRNDYYNFSVWDMVLYNSVKKQKNLTVYFNTVMEDCVTQEDCIRQISAYQLTTETRWIIDSKIFLDCTGNGTLGYLSGARYRTGSESTDEFHEPDAPKEPDNCRMGNTLLFKAVDKGHSVNFKRPDFARVFTEEDLKYRTHSAVHGVRTREGEKADDTYLRLTSYSTSSVDYGYWWIELPGEKEDIIDEYETIRDELVSCIYGVWDHLKNGGDHKAGNYDLEWVGMLPGTRESRRLEGDYILNENDILSNRSFEDAVAYGGWAMDIHPPGGLFDFDELPSKVIGFEGAYTIPYRCYYSANIRNLMMAGRNISVSRMAFGSTRVMGTCAIGGQAVGTAAAMCIKYHCLPKEILNHMRELQQTLLEDDCYIPGIRNEDKSDLARMAQVTASSEREGCQAASVVNGVSRGEGTQKNIWISEGISKDGEWILLKLKERRAVSEVRLTFDSNFTYAIKLTMSDRRQKQQRIGVPPELVKDYTVILWDGENIAAKKHVKDNVQRANKVVFDSVVCDRVQIKIHETNGAQDVHIYEIRIKADPDA